MERNLSIIHKISEDTKSGKMVWYNEYETNSGSFFVSVLDVSKCKKIVFRYSRDNLTNECFMVIRMMEKHKGYKVILSLTSNNYVYGEDMDIIYFAIKHSNPKKKPSNFLYEF